MSKDSLASDDWAAKEAIRKVTRFEVIDFNGRVYTAHDVKIELSYQDDCRTLKVFVSDRV